MTNRSVRLFKITVPVKKIATLTPHQRYVYYLLGHVFNEIMSLHKMIGFALPTHGDFRPERRNAEISQVFFLMRLAGSKLYEFQSTINRAEIKVALDEIVFSKSPHLKDGLKEFNRAVGGARWLARLRNGIGFHYPKFTDWERYTTPNETWIDDVIYAGEQAGNTFYDASSMVAMHWMFDEYRNFDPAKAVTPLADELIGMLRQLNSLLESMIGTIVSHLIPDERAETLGKIIAPEHDKVSLPYWTHLANMEKKYRR